MTSKQKALPKSGTATYNGQSVQVESYRDATADIRVHGVLKTVPCHLLSNVNFFTRIDYRNIADLETEQAAKLEAIVHTTSAVVRTKLEAEIEDLEQKIKAAGKERFRIQITRGDIKAFMREAKHIMEHPSEMLLNSSNPRAQQALFGLVFEEMPTYADILNGTPKLSYVFELSSGFAPSKSQLVTPRGIEPRFPA